MPATTTSATTAATRSDTGEATEAEVAAAAAAAASAISSGGEEVDLADDPPETSFLEPAPAAPVAETAAVAVAVPATASASAAALMAAVNGGSDVVTMGAPRVFVPDSTIRLGLVEAPELPSLEFDSWDIFEEHLQQYQRATYQKYINRSTTSVKSRNASIEKKKFKNFTDMLPEEYGVYRKTMICTHGYGGRPSRGSGQRAHRKPRNTACKAKLVVCLRKRYSSTSAKYMVIVQLHDRVHNHQLSPELYASYPENRRIEDPHVIETVRDMLRAGARRRQVWKYLKETSGKAISMKDMHNLAAKLKAQLTATSDVDMRVLNLLNSVRSDSDNSDVDEEDEQEADRLNEMADMKKDMDGVSGDANVTTATTDAVVATSSDLHQPPSADGLSQFEQDLQPIQYTDSDVGLHGVWPDDHGKNSDDHQRQRAVKRMRVMTMCARIAQKVANDDFPDYDKFIDFLGDVESTCDRGQVPYLGKATTEQPQQQDRSVEYTENQHIGQKRQHNDSAETAI
ncbi:TPA: hypothetical protein N0F65_003436 [Lagenidium giganteum]|uniref:FAR1 domain-containing protein n=1 Tax=Lagenidium giganteum TaxID=4803 RepID=A0AAV2YM52_9STRA|nr:TPA: hypothetical protein N0F65_003436 [Lagenidium giganteum]